MKRFLSLTLSLLFFTLNLNAQKTIRGQVIDNETGESLIGVNIIQLQTDNGVATDIDGNFKLDVKSLPCKEAVKFT